MEQIWAKRLREQMTARGFNMRSLSAAISQNETYIRDILTRGRTPTIDKFVRIAEALGVSVAYLIGESETAPDESQVGDETKLRAALLSFGVDGSDLRRVVAIIKGFADDLDESPARTPLDDQSAPANRRRAEEPS